MSNVADVERICLAALEHPANERAAFLADACQGDDALRQDVESLLAHASPAEPFLEHPAVEGQHALSGLSGLSLGQRLGAYHIIARLGAGGMGEVYRARDTQLGREVAIKILPVVFATDPERLARFEREARVLASLNHPHIAAIYGIETAFTEQEHRIRALVMELVDGVTLAARIARGPLRVLEALTIARQIADALDAAHERGVIHRDLKPANIMVRADGVVKVLDFGLAKALSAGEAGGSDDLAGKPRHSPATTLTAPHEGVLIGTAAYMSPEQARGLPADRRSDIWAFGCVLYELLTGVQAFTGDRSSDVMARIIEREPDFAALPAHTPAAIRRLLRRCLTKNPQERLRSAGDGALDITEALTAPHNTAAPLPTTSGHRTTVLWVATACVAGASAAVALWLWMTPASAPAVVRYSIAPSPAAPLVTNIVGGRQNVSVSADGTTFAYLSTDGFVIRSGDQLDLKLVKIPEPYFAQPFLSPDGRWLGYTRPGALMKIPVAGGPSVPLALPGGGVSPLGASWGVDDTIVYATESGLFRVPAAGGAPERILAPDRETGDHAFGWPAFLPDGRVVLFTVIGRAGTQADARIEALDLQSGTRKVLLRGGSRARYVTSGHLVYAAGDVINAVAFNPDRLEPLGNPVPVVTIGGSADYAVSADGTLVHLAKAASDELRELVWVDRAGGAVPVGADPKPYEYPRLSHDFARVALVTGGVDRNVLVWDFLLHSLQLFTVNDPSANVMAAWSHDGRLAFSSHRSGVRNMFWQASDGSGSPEPLFVSTRAQAPISFTPDGKWLLLGEEQPEKGLDIFALALNPKGQMERIVGGPGTQSNPEVSPDGDWLAYDSNESGESEVLVRPFAGAAGGRRTVGKGKQPFWARDGSELFYLSPDGAMMAVSVAAGEGLTLARPQKLFDGPQYLHGGGARSYDVGRDGRFLMIRNTAAGGAAAGSIVVVHNWFEELKRLAPPPD
jgi:serine/threonine protein kinase